MRGIYEASAVIASVSAAKTLILIEAPADLVLEILAARITQDNVDTNEQLRAGLYKVTTKGSPAGTSVTPQRTESGDQASSCTLLSDLSAEPTTYNSTGGHGIEGFSNLAGYRFDPLPEDRLYIPPSGLVGLRLLTTPASAFQGIISITFREIG